MDYKEFFQELTMFTGKIYSETFGTDEHILKDYFGKSRKREIVDVRNIVIWIAFKNKFEYLNDMSGANITGYFLKDHAIVYNARDKCLNLCDTNTSFNEVFNQVEAKFFELAIQLTYTPTESDVKRRLKEAEETYFRLGKLIDKLESELLTLK